MGKILDKVFGRSSGGNRPDGSTLGLSTPTTWSGNTAFGPGGGRATHFGTTQADGRVTNVRAITANDYRAAPSSPKKGRSLFGKSAGAKPSGGFSQSQFGSGAKGGSPKKGGIFGSGSKSGRPNGSTLGVTTGKTTTKSNTPASKSSTTKKAAGGLIEGNDTMKKTKRMNMGGLPTTRPERPSIPPNMGDRPGMAGKMGQKIRAMAQAPGRMGGLGRQMSALARAQRGAAPSVASQTMKAGGVVKRMNSGGMSSGAGMADDPQRFERRVSRISQRFPGYTPATEGPINTREAFKTYKQGFRDWRAANPDVKPIGGEGKRGRGPHKGQGKSNAPRLNIANGYFDNEAYEKAMAGGGRGRGHGMMGGRKNALSRRTGNLERFKSKMEGMASNPKFADIIAKKQKMLDAFKARIPAAAPTMKAGGLVKGAKARGSGCAQRGTKHSKKMG